MSKNHIVIDFIAYLDGDHSMSDKNAEYERVLKVLRGNGDKIGIKLVKDAYDEYLIDGRAWVDMEAQMTYLDEDF